MSRLLVLLALLGIGMSALVSASPIHSSLRSVSRLFKGGDECNGNDYGTAGQFDFYVFAQSWPAQFCSAHSSWPGCSNPTAWQQTNLTIHGLWPNYAQAQGSHEWPQCCQSTYGSSFSAAVFQKYKYDFSTFWPNEQDPSGSNLGNSLWNHEWGKHGTCSGLSQNDYFTSAFTVSSQMPTADAIVNNIGGSTTTQAILRFYGATCTAGNDCVVGLACDNSNNLSGITTCWNKNLQQIVCPSAVIGQGQCSDGTVGITSF